MGLSLFVAQCSNPICQLVYNCTGFLGPVRYIFMVVAKVNKSMASVNAHHALCLHMWGLNDVKIPMSAILQISCHLHPYTCQVMQDLM